ncbi:MAG: hypothetical protein RLZZ587_857, partial [Actinomycetota bacterium]
MTELAALTSLLPTVAGVIFFLLAGVRWIRVAQREHYIPGWTDTIARHWLAVRPLSWLPLVISTLVLASVAFTENPIAINVGWAVAIVITSWWPSGMGFRGRTSPLQWTARARRLALMWTAVWGVVTALGSIAVVVAGDLLLALFS